MKKLIRSFTDLTADQLYEILKLRQEVFIIEQDCIYNDFDGYDQKADHLMIYQNEKLAAYSRIFAPGIKYKNESSIGRIIVKQGFRGETLGRSLIDESIQFCQEFYSDSDIKIEAQAALQNYYSKFGFKPISEIFPVDGIDHLEMVLDFKM